MYALCRAVIVTASLIVPCAADPVTRTVLILDQSTSGLAAYGRLSGALRTTINADIVHATTIYAEHLDMSLFRGPAYERTLTNYLRDKYNDTPIAIIVAIGAAALEFALKLRATQFAAVPIVFCAVDARMIHRQTLPPNVTGQTIRLSLNSYVDVARALIPDLAKIVLVGDPLERQPFRQEFAAELPSIASTVTVDNLLGLPLADVTRRVASLPANSVIAFTTLTADGAGAVHTPIRALEAVAESANRPILVDVETYLGHGATGGLVVLPDVIGTHAAELVLRLLNGESATQIPISALTDEVKPIFDWRQLKQWGISESQLPPGSEVRFRKLTIWEEHNWLILVGTSAFFLQTALIIGLLYEDRRRRVAEAEARQRLTESAYLSRVITAGALSASIAHEIRQPLAAIVAYGDAGLRWLTNKEPDYAEVRHSLTKIVDQGHRASAIIEKVRALFKKDVGHRTVLDMNAIIRDVIGLTSNELKKHYITIKANLMAPPPLVVGDRVQLEQVILNLIMNAIEAMRHVKSRNRVLSVRSRVENVETVTITMEDSGPGLDPEHIGKIFSPYFTTKPAGMGMGLAICRSIIGSHGGQITVSSVPNHGAAFHVTLPLHSEVK
ncbi:MAG TPA: ABC transporter substrate binding protein [Pseudolabrys sp.]|jgi:signal transduction histidine kinase